MGPSLGGNSLWVSLSLYLETFSLFFRPSQNPTNYTYSCSARRDESIGITLMVFGDGRLFFEKISKYRNSKSLAARGRARSERRIKATIAEYPKSYTKRLVSASLTRLDKVKVNLREKLFLLSLRGEVRTRVSKSQKWSRINFFSKYGNFNIFEFDPPFDRSRRDKHFRLLFSSGNMTGSGSKSRLKIGLKIENRTSGCPILTFRPCIDITRWGD